jgi:MFS transporter, AAHS family, 4-hydroxybenzoate transporter
MITGAGLDISVATNGLAAFNIGGVAGAILGGLCIARIGSRPTMLTMTVGAILGAAALAMTPLHAGVPHAPIITLLGLTGAFINGVQTTMYALAAHVYPTSIRATGVGTAVAVGRGGGVISSYVGAWALEAGGSAASLALVGRHVPRT